MALCPGTFVRFKSSTGQVSDMLFCVGNTFSYRERECAAVVPCLLNTERVPLSSVPRCPGEMIVDFPEGLTISCFIDLHTAVPADMLVKDNIRSLDYDEANMLHISCDPTGEYYGLAPSGTKEQDDLKVEVIERSNSFLTEGVAILWSLVE